MHTKQGAPTRIATEVGPGDYIQLRHKGRFWWERIVSNTAYGAERTPRNWTITTARGNTYTMWDAYRYARAEDMQR